MFSLPGTWPPPKAAIDGVRMLGPRGSRGVSARSGPSLA